MERIPISDERLKDAIKKACILEDERYDRILEDTGHEFSGQYLNKMKYLLRNSTEPKNNYSCDDRRKKIISKRYVVIAIIIALVASVSVFASEAIEEQHANQHEQYYSEDTEILAEDSISEMNNGEENITIHEDNDINVSQNTKRIRQYK